MSVLSALVVYLRYNGTLSYSAASRELTLTAGSDVGVRKTLLHVPIANIINVETREEREARETSRQPLSSSSNNSSTNRDADDIETGCFGGFRVEGSSPPAIATRTTPPPLFFLHHVPAKASKGKDIRTVSFCARSGAEEALAAVVAAVHLDVYRSGAKRIVAFISPVSGAGKAQKMWNETVCPVLRCTKHRILPIVTTHRFHCEQYLADVKNDLSDKDIVVVVGGDGMMHEAVNGLDQRRRAFGASFPVGYTEPLLATVPAGSGCALAKAFSILEPIQAALAIVHAEAVTIDLMRLTFINTERREPQTAAEKKAKAPVKTSVIDASGLAPRISFLNVAMGLTCEIDRGSEKWRWMGNARFTVYAGQLVVQGLKPYCIRIRYVPWKSRAVPGLEVVKMSSADKYPKDFQFCSHRDDCPMCRLHAQEKLENAALPIGEEDWVTVPEDCHVMAMANNLQDAARDMAIAPYAHIADGSIDVVMGGSMKSDNIRPVPRGKFISVFLGLEDGKHIHSDLVSYVKCRAVEFLPVEGILMSDGEVLEPAGCRVTNVPNGVRVVRSM